MSLVWFVGFFLRVLSCEFCMLDEGHVGMVISVWFDVCRRKSVCQAYPEWWTKCRIPHVCSHQTAGNTVHSFEFDCQIVNGL